MHKVLIIAYGGLSNTPRMMVVEFNNHAAAMEAVNNLSGRTQLKAIYMAHDAKEGQ